MKGLLGKIAAEFFPWHDFDSIKPLEFPIKYNAYSRLCDLADWVFLSFKHTLRGMAVGGGAGALGAHLCGENVEYGFKGGVVIGACLDVAQVSFRGVIIPTYNYLFRKKKSNKDNEIR